MHPNLLRPTSSQSAQKSAPPYQSVPEQGRGWHFLLGWTSILALIFFCTTPALALRPQTGRRPAEQRPTKRGTKANAAHPVVLRLSATLADHDSHGFVQLFSKDADVRIGSRLLADGPAGIWHALEEPPMSETTAFHVVQKSARAVDPDVVIVYAEMVQYGSLFVRRAFPLQLVLKRTGTEWKIISFWLPHAPSPGPVRH